MKNYKLYNVDCGVNDGTAFMFTQLYEVLPNGDERKINKEEWVNSEETEGKGDFLPENWVFENTFDGKYEDGICELFFLSLGGGKDARVVIDKLLGDLWKRGKGGVVNITK